MHLAALAVLAARRKDALLPAKETFGRDALPRAFIEELVRLDDRQGLLGVLDARHVAEPRLLPHRIDIEVLRAEALDDGERALGLRAREPARLIVAPRDRPRQQWAIDPG